MHRAVSVFSWAVVVAIVLHVTTSCNGFSASWGQRTPNDILLRREHVLRRPVANNYWNASIVFPGKGQSNKRVITSVFVYDHFTNTSGAKPIIHMGGPGHKVVAVHFLSQQGRGINSTLEIYGRK